MNNSNRQVLGVAIAVCLVCSVIVSSASVSLRGLQAENQLLDKRRNILTAAGLLAKNASRQSVQHAFRNIETRLVDLDAGRFVPRQSEIAEQLFDYDVRIVSRDKRFSEVLEASTDIAGLKRREQYAQIYLVREQNNLKSIVIPVRGYGLWSTLYGFVALKPDFTTVIGMGFYQHGETPGLGGEVDNPRWKRLWNGKQIYKVADDAKQVALLVGKKSSSVANIHHIDALSGATITTRGVHNMMHYWFGRNGFGPFLTYLQSSNFISEG